jgi:hypothetical protein
MTMKVVVTRAENSRFVLPVRSPVGNFREKRGCKKISKFIWWPQLATIILHRFAYALRAKTKKNEAAQKHQEQKQIDAVEARCCLARCARPTGQGIRQVLCVPVGGIFLRRASHQCGYMYWGI